MADIISHDRTKDRKRAIAAGDAGPCDGTAPAAAFADQDGLVPLVEMLFFAYRDFTGEADVALEAYGLGRAHHRVLHFVNRTPGVRVADLLVLLKITKQSLGRVLRKLIADRWIEQVPGPDDRRERRLTLTPRGLSLAAELAALQTRRIGAALQEIEQGGRTPARDLVQDFLFAMISHGERAAVSALLDGAAEARALSVKPLRTKREQLA